MTDQSGDAVTRYFHDFELAYLTEHLAKVEVRGFIEQKFLNKLFISLQLSRFERINPRAVKPTTSMSKYEVTAPEIQLLGKLLETPMPGAVARIIGAGSSFFERLIALNNVAPVPESADRAAAIPEPTNADTPQATS